MPCDEEVQLRNLILILTSQHAITALRSSRVIATHLPRPSTALVIAYLQFSSVRQGIDAAIAKTEMLKIHVCEQNTHHYNEHRDLHE